MVPMAHSSFRETVGLLFGDVAVFIVSLWLTLFIRHAQVPSQELFFQHVAPFFILFAVWVAIFFIAGLYDKRTAIVKQRLPATILRAQIVNIVLAALFFFFIPYFGITPKTVLFIYLVVSMVLIVSWRLYAAPLLGIRRRQNAVLIGEGAEVDELYQEVNAHPSYGIRFVHRFAPHEVVKSDRLQEQFYSFISGKNITLAVADIRDPNMEFLMPIFYNLLFLHPQFTFIDTAKLYESVFQRIPVSLLGYHWFLEHITARPRFLYDSLHRLIDITGSIILGIPTLLLAPLVALAIKLEDGGTVFSVQERVGKNNRPLKLVKFRTMTVANDAGEWERVPNQITRVGSFLRKTRIDELPQLYNVLFGEYSLIGPRPEMPPAVSTYAREIPYYNVRHLITPGLSGWAQLYHEQHPHKETDVAETRNKLSYDLYYIKNRSFMLDVAITLKTIKTLLARAGR